MSLYLSRLSLNPFFAPSLKVAADPYALHQKLLITLPCQKDKPKTENQPKTAEVLFRVDTDDFGPSVLIQSAHIPDWDALELAPRALRCNPETKPYAPEFAKGQRLSFRLLCKPSVRKSGDFGQKANGKRKPGPRITSLDDEQRLEWLHWKGKDHGFQIETVGLTLFSTAVIKPKDSNESQGDEKKGRFASSVRFDGVLVVTDADELFEAVKKGIGIQKAFGFGLLSLGPIRE